MLHIQHPGIKGLNAIPNNLQVEIVDQYGRAGIQLVRGHCPGWIGPGDGYLQGIRAIAGNRSRITIPIIEAQFLDDPLVPGIRGNQLRRRRGVEQSPAIGIVRSRGSAGLVGGVDQQGPQGGGQWQAVIVSLPVVLLQQSR